MKKLILLMFIVAIAGAGWYYLMYSGIKIPAKQEVLKEYKSDFLGFSFEYRTEPEGYVLIEQDESDVPHEEILKHLTLVNRKEYEELLESDIPREGPPAIIILVFNNINAVSPEEWIKNEGFVSNIGIATSEAVETQLAGLPAARYTIDGLYPAEVIVAASKSRVYYISGAYLSPDSQIRSDFFAILETFNF